MLTLTMLYSNRGLWPVGAPQWNYWGSGSKINLSTAYPNHFRAMATEANSAWSSLHGLAKEHYSDGYGYTVRAVGTELVG